MADAKYDIYFRGEVLPEKDPQQVKQAIGRLFKANDEKLAALFSGQLNTIKKSVDKATASKYQQAFKKAGAKAIITLAKATEQPPEKSAAGDWGVLPVGSDLLKPEERQQQDPVNVDISKIKMQSPFAEPESVEKPAALVPSTDHITVAAVGEDMNPNRPAPAKEPDLDLSQLSVAEAGVELVEKKPKDIPPVPNTDHIKLV